MGTFDSLILGICLSLLGMGIIEDTVYSLAGSKFYNVCKRFVSTPLRGGLLGLGISSLLGRSSLIRLFAIGFVATGAMALAPGFMLTLWADVGATSLVFLVGVSFGFGLVPILGIAGVLYLRLPSSTIKEFLGLVFGIGLLVFAISLIKTGGTGLAEFPAFKEYFATENSSKFIIFLGSVLLTILTQSPVALTVILLAILKGEAANIEFIALCLYGVNFGKTLPAKALKT